MALLATDPVTLKMGADGKLDVLAMASSAPFDRGLTAVVTGVRTRLRLIAGEWFLNLDKGMPWYERDGIDSQTVILGSKYDETTIRVPMLRAILDTPGVVEVTQLVIQFDPVNRSVSITWSARCEFGETEPDTLTVPEPG
jgi:hypothetical protein